MRLCTYNIRSLKSSDRIIQLENALINIKYDIIGISEVKVTGQSITERDGYILMYRGDKKGRNGVGFIVASYLKNYIIEFITYSDRVVRLDLKFEDNLIFNIIQVYAPTERAKEKEVTTFYKDLTKALDGTQRDTIIMGDFNSKIGTPLKEEKDICGLFGYGERNERGELLLSFCYEHRMAITNTFFKKHAKQKWTWVSPGGNTFNEVDFILVKQQQKQKVSNVEVLSTTHSTDHRMVRMTYIINMTKKSRTGFTGFSGKNNNFNPIEVESLKNLMFLQIHKIETENNINDSYKTTISTIKDCINKLPKRKKERYEQPITKEVEKLILEREELKAIYPRSIKQKKRLTYLHRKTIKMIKSNMKNIKMQSLEKELSDRSSTKYSRKKFDHNREWIQTIKNQTGQNTGNRRDIIKIATNFYSTLYSSSESADVQPANINKTVPAFLSHEIERGINNLKKNKSPGEDGISSDTLIAMIEPLAPQLTKIFNKIIENEDIPEDWHYSIITLLYKKGDPNVIDNYRPISLLPTLYKLFSSVTLFRITRALDEQQPREQAGFRKGFSTVDHIFTLTQCIERCNEFNKIIYLAYVDYTKAFDSISHRHLWDSLREQGVEEKYISILKVIYNNCQAKIKTEMVGPPFAIKRGVKQGDPISPKLFTAIIESMFRRLDWSNFGININGERLTHLRFADDIVILAESHTQLQCMLNTLDTESRKIGLYMNLTKTKVMTNGDPRPIKLEDINIEYVSEYIYLGQLITFQDLTAKEVDRRIATAWKKYWANKDVFKSKIPPHLKKRLMDNTILPSLLYGCQTWALTKGLVKKLSIFQRAAERSMLGLKLMDKVKNIDIRKKTKVIDAAKMLCRLKWRWAGHVARATDNRWSERIIHWQPRDTARGRGRPRSRWCDDIVQVAGATWTRLAKDRKAWQDMEESLYPILGA